VLFRLRTDSHVTINAADARSIRADVGAALGHRFGARLDRVEVYVEAADAGGPGVRCSLKVYPTAGPAVAVEEYAADSGLAVEGAVEKAVEEIDRLHDLVGVAAAGSSVW
jgi:hypothetical protein